MMQAYKKNVIIEFGQFCKYVFNDDVHFAGFNERH